MKFEQFLSSLTATQVPRHFIKKKRLWN